MGMSIKKNFAYNGILTVSNYLFPLLVYPYVSRVLGVTNIGICNYVDSVINYFILFSMMGISATGIREIAAHRDNRDKMDGVFTSLLCLNAIFTFVAALVLVGVIYCVPQFFEYRRLMWIGVVKLLGNLFLCEWLFRGVEDFRYITKRTIAIKLIYVLSVFLCVREQSDYVLYFLLTSLSIVANALVNCYCSRRLVSLRPTSVSISPYLKSFLTVGVYLILSSFYTSFNVLFLGLVAGPTEVGYYTTATKLFTIVISIYTAFTQVMLPRMSALYAQGERDAFLQVIRKSESVLLSLSIPLVIFCLVFAPDIIAVFAGAGYEGAYIPTRVMMPLIFIIGYEQILVLQILMPMKKDVEIFLNAFIGALVGVGLNLYIVQVMGWQSVGSAVVWLISEVVVLLSAQYWTRRTTGQRFPVKMFLRNVAAYAPVAIVCLLIYVCTPSVVPLVRLLIAGTAFLLVSFGVQMRFVKDETLMQMIDKISNKLKYINS